MLERQARVQKLWNALGDAYGAEWSKIGGKRRAQIAYAIVDAADKLMDEQPVTQDADAEYVKRMQLGARHLAERQIVRATINAALARGWSLDFVDNGGDEEKVNTVDEAMEAAFAADDARIHFRAGFRTAWLYAVLGNDGWDVISDYTTNLDDAVKSTDGLVSEWERRLS